MAPLVLTGRSAARTERLLVDRVPVLPRQLDFALLPSSASPIAATDDNSDSSENELMCFDDELVYTRFFADFGPLNLAQTVRFVRETDERLTRLSSNSGSLDNDPAAATESDTCPVVVVFTSDHPHKRANTMALLAVYLVISHGRTPLEAVTPFRSLTPPFGFRDAALGVCSFHLSLLDCARAVHKAMATRLWRPETFDVAEFERLAKLENGDVTWTVPGKLLAFRGPRPQRERFGNDHITTMLAPEYAKALRALGVTCVVRFNEPESYDRRAFIHAGIRHVELEYPDGGIPTDAILYQFLRLCDREIAVGGVVAAHCAAGLGRTGTHMAAWLMRSTGFSAREAIAWCRICRPGSVVGVQQHFLVAKERQLRMRDASSELGKLQEDEKMAGKVHIKARRRLVTMGNEVNDGGRSLRPVVAHAKASRHHRKLPPPHEHHASVPTWSTHPTRSRHGSG